MSESTCVMQPFSYTSPDFSHETSEENPMYGIGESVSFGRFTSDNTSWERWSTFNNNRNRYVEEAEKYSRPGSVAQKKAYFEAHFKRMAALKAAALLEQENAAQNTQESVKDGVKSLNSFAQVDSNELKSERVGGEGEKKVDNAGFVVHKNELFSDEEQEVNDEKGVDSLMQEKSRNQSKLNPESLEVENNKNKEKEETSGITHMDKPPLKKTAIGEVASVALVKRNPPLSSYIPSINGICKAPLSASSPANSAATFYPGKENYATPIKQKSSISNPEKKRTPLRASINREFNKILSPVIKKIGTSSKGYKDCSTPSKTPAKDTSNGMPEYPPTAPNLARKGGRSHHRSPAFDNKVPGPRWNILSTDGFKSPNIVRNRISSPIIPTSICMKGGERGPRRKQKLEEKFNLTATDKAPATKFKVKAEAEFNKIRQTFCFKVMSSPDHCSENETPNASDHKGELTHCSSLRQSRQPFSCTTEKRSSLPPRKPAVTLTGCKTQQRMKS